MKPLPIKTKSCPLCGSSGMFTPDELAFRNNMKSGYGETIERILHVVRKIELICPDLNDADKRWITVVVLRLLALKLENESTKCEGK